jgi:hypothetical protein
MRKWVFALVLMLSFAGIQVKTIEAQTTVPTSISILLSNFMLSSGESTNFTAILRDANGNPLSNKVIEWRTTLGTFSSSTTVTDSYGQASVTYTAPIVNIRTPVTIYASFAGDAYYSGTTASSSGLITASNLLKLLPTADAYVSRDSPYSNFGAESRLLWQYTGGTPPDAYRSYLKFDLSRLPRPAIIRSAILYLYNTTVPPVPYWMGDSFDVFSVYADDWLENEITWNNAPPLAEPIVDRGGGRIPVSAWIASDVTEFVRGEYERFDNFVSLGIKVNGWDGTLTQANSKEAGEHQPYLEVDYAIPPIPTTLTFSPTNFQLKPGENLVLTVTLKDNGDYPVSGRTVYFSTTFGTLSAPSNTTDSLGRITVIYTAPWVTENTKVLITASFPGDNCYGASSQKAEGLILAPPLPDLTIEDLIIENDFYQPSQCNYVVTTVKFSVVNKGSAEVISDGSNLEAWIETFKDNQRVAGNTIIWASGFKISPGTSVTVVSSAIFVQAGWHEIRVTIDPQNKIQESNEANNISHSYVFNPLAPENLGLVKITWPLNQSKWASPGFLEIKVEVEDIDVAKVEFYVDGSLVATDNSPPYQAILRTIPYSEPIFDSPHTISVIVTDKRGQRFGDNVTITLVRETSYWYNLKLWDNFDPVPFSKQLLSSIVSELGVYTYYPEYQIPNLVNPMVHLSGVGVATGYWGTCSIRFNVELDSNLKSKLDRLMSEKYGAYPGYYPPWYPEIMKTTRLEDVLTPELENLWKLTNEAVGRREYSLAYELAKQLYSKAGEEALKRSTTSENAKTAIYENLCKSSENFQAGSPLLSISPETFTLESGSTLLLVAMLLDPNFKPIPNRVITWRATVGEIWPAISVTDLEGKVEAIYHAPQVSVQTAIMVIVNFEGDNQYTRAMAISKGVIVPPPMPKVVENLLESFRELKICLENLISQGVKTLTQAISEGKIAIITTVKLERETGEIKIRRDFQHEQIQAKVEVRGNAVVAIVSSENRDGRTVILNIDNRALPILDLRRVEVEVDGEKIPLADSYEDVLDPNNDGDQAEYLILAGGEGVQVLVSIPHFSARTITIRGPIATAPAARTPLLLATGIVAIVLILFFVFRRCSGYLQSIESASFRQKAQLLSF